MAGDATGTFGQALEAMNLAFFPATTAAILNFMTLISNKA